MITLSKSGNSVTFTFDENSGYLQNGTIDVPVNSLSLILDESNMATFRKSASNDIFVSANVGDFGMSKAELEAWYKANMVSSGGGGGGGSTYTAGRGISIENDTISFSLPISAGTGENSIQEGEDSQASGYNSHSEGGFTIASGDYSHSEGRSTSATSQGSHSEGENTTASGNSSHSEGNNTKAIGDYSHSEGRYTIASGQSSHSEGIYTSATTRGSHTEGDHTIANNLAEHASGRFNVSSSGSSTFGDSGNTLFSVGNGTNQNNRHNAFEIRQNGDIYLTSGGTDIKLQDHLGGGGGGSSYTAGDGIDITNDVISVTGKTDTSAFTSYTTATDARLAEDEEVTARALIDINDLSENKADVSAVTEIAEAISGKADVSAVTAIDSAVSGLTERVGEDEEVTARALIDLDEKKLDASAYTPVDLSDYYTTAQTDSKISEAVSGKQDTLVSGTNIKTINNISLLGSGNIDIQGGGGSGGCTVDETVIYDTLSNDYYYQVGGDGDKYEYVILDNHNDKTIDVRNIYFTIGDDSNNYAEGYIRFDYPNHSASTTDESNTALTEYTTIEYISDINDFKVSVASSYQATTWIKSIQNLFNTEVKVEFYKINSGSPCTAIETDVVGLVEKVKGKVDNSLKLVSLTSQQNKINVACVPNKGYSQINSIRLDELDGTNSVLKPNIKVGLGTSGWTEVSFSQGQCTIDSLNGLKFRITYANDFDPENGGFMIQTSFYYGNNQTFDMIQYDSQNQTAYGSISYITTAATYEWSASTKELVITYPATVEYGGETVDVRIDGASCNCQLGYSIIKFETYGELKQDLKPYVQETRAALGGLSLVKLTQVEYDALVTKDSNTLYVVTDS